MLATLPSQPPSLTDKAYVYEPKVDGIRAIVEVLPGNAEGRRSRFWSRNGNEKTAQFPDIVDAIGTWLKTITAPVVLDGEVVALDAEMRPAGFQRLQHRIHVTRARLQSKKTNPAARRTAGGVHRLRPAARRRSTICATCALDERRERLEALFKKHQPPTSDLVRLTAQAIGDGTALMKQARSRELGGLDGQARRGRRIATGKRSPEWMKLQAEQAG